MQASLLPHAETGAQAKGCPTQGREAAPPKRQGARETPPLQRVSGKSAV